MVTSFEFCDDLAEKPSFKSWNSFQHYRRWIVVSGLGQSGSIGTWRNLASSAYYDKYNFASPLWGHGATPSWYSTAIGSLDNPTAGLPMLMATTGGVRVNIPFDVTPLVNEALKSLIPKLRPEVEPSLSLINSIIELKDFRSLPKTLDRVSELTWRLAEKAKTMMNWASLKRIFRTAGESNLTYQFAIAPLLSDIVGYHSALKKARKRANALLNLETRTHRAHVNFDAVTASGLQRFISTTATGGTATMLSTGTTCPATMSLGKVLGTMRADRDAQLNGKFHAEVEYNVYFSQYQRENAALLTLLDMLGVNLNPGIIWNALPWSFVVDWLFRVGSWLDQFKMANMEPLVLIKRFLYSVKLERTCHVNLMYNIGASPGLPVCTTSMPYFTEHAYKRVVGIPASYSTVVSDLRAGGLDLNRVGLASSLAMTRKPGRPS